MANHQINDLKIHGPAVAGIPENFHGQPSIYIDFNYSDITISNGVASCTVSGHLNYLGGYDFFGYSIDVKAYIKVKDGASGSKQTIISKPNLPNTWSDNSFSSGQKTLTLSTTASSLQLVLELTSNCNCHSNTPGVPQTKQVWHLDIQAQESGWPITYAVGAGSGTPPSSQTKLKDVDLTLRKKTHGSMVAPTYRIRYDTNGGTAIDDERRNRAFTAWHPSSAVAGHPDDYQSGEVYKANKGNTMTAQWGSATYPSLPTPTQSNCRFKAWHRGSLSGPIPSSGAELTGNVTLVAMWDYKVSYSLDGGTIDWDGDNRPTSIASGWKVYNQAYQITQLSVTKPGKIFKGWKISGTTTTLQPGGNIPASRNEYTLLTPEWEAAKYTIKIDANGGKFKDNSTLKTYSGLDYTKSPFTLSGLANLAPPTREGYHFIKWSSNLLVRYQNDSTKAYEYRMTKVTQDLTIKAVWQKVPVWQIKSGTWKPLF